MKGIKLFLCAAVSAATFISATSLFAATSLPYGWYVEGNAGSSKATKKTYGTNTTTSSNGVGFNLDVGYKFAPYFAAEIGYTKYAKTNIKANGGTAAKDSHFSYDLAGKGMLPISDTGLELFAKVGWAKSKSHVTISNTTYASGTSITQNTSSSTGLYMGLGGAFAISSSLNANVQWARTKGNNKVGYLDLYSAGLTWLFA